MARPLDQRIGTYKPGSLRRIKLHNFVTYSDVVVRPGPRLNMVIGPNGTGKSTILCAICLGLGGEPRLLGRADDIATFIMHEKDRAVVELELAPFPNQPVHTLRRVIEHKHGASSARSRSTGHSTFFLNNVQVSAKKVRELVQESYHISVDNLCTFLPQDRVGNFSGFNAQDLLCETEKSMSGNKHLYDTHMRLIQMEEDLLKGGASLDTIQDRLKKLEVENERLEREKERMEERELAIEQADLLDKKCVWLKYDDARNTAFELKETQKAKKDALRTAQQKLRPLEEVHAEILSKTERAQAKYKTLHSSLAKSKKAIEKHKTKFSTHNDEVEELQAEMNSLEAEQNNAARDVERQQDKVQEIEAQIADRPSAEELAKATKEASEENNRHRPALEQAKKSLLGTEMKKRELEESVKMTMEKLKLKQDEKTQRRQRVFHQFQHLEDICGWIDQNRKRFRRPVHGPVACEISSKNNNAAACLEFHVATSLFKAFVVETREDYDLLYREIREKLNKPINVIIVPNGQLNPVARQYSPSKMQTLQREHGVLGYMDDSFTAPDAIMQALRNGAGVEKVLIGTDKTQESLDRKSLLEYLGQREDGGAGTRGSCVFTSSGGRTYRYVSTISRYSKKTSLSVDDVGPPKILAACTKAEVLAKLEAEIKEGTSRLEQLSPRVQTLRATYDELTRDQQQVRANWSEAKAAQVELNKLEQRLGSAKRKLNDAKERANVNNSAAKQRIVRQLMARVANCIGALDSHADSHRQVMESTFETAGVRINQDGLLAVERRAREKLEEGQSEFQELESEAHKAIEAFKSAKICMKELWDLAEEKAPLQDAEGTDLPLKARLDALQVNTVEETEAALEEATARINSIDANPDVVRQYEERKMDIVRIRAQLSDLTDSKDAKLQEIEQLRKPWEASLQNAVHDVNELFAKYMQELGNLGEIRLSKGDATTEAPRRSRGGSSETGKFKDWGIQIMVKFREAAKLQRLSAQVQSGGERSVSTIMYLMALQEMMVSPFRCVDEINQGLDERNERLVFRRIVQNSSRSPEGDDLTNHSGQYFLITPKLLPNLYDMEVDAMTVLFVFNGPFGFDSPTDWDADAFVREAKRSHPNRGNEENEGAGENAVESDEEASPQKKQCVE